MKAKITSIALYFPFVFFFLFIVEVNIEGNKAHGQNSLEPQFPQWEKVSQEDNSLLFRTSDPTSIIKSVHLQRIPNDEHFNVTLTLEFQSGALSPNSQLILIDYLKKQIQDINQLGGKLKVMSKVQETQDNLFTLCFAPSMSNLRSVLSFLDFLPIMAGLSKTRALGQFKEEGKSYIRKIYRESQSKDSQLTFASLLNLNPLNVPIIRMGSTRDNAEEDIVQVGSVRGDGNGRGILSPVSRLQAAIDNEVSFRSLLNYPQRILSLFPGTPHGRAISQVLAYRQSHQSQQGHQGQMDNALAISFSYPQPGPKKEKPALTDEYYTKVTLSQEEFEKNPNNVETKCPICFEKVADTLTASNLIVQANCSHYFCGSCFENTFKIMGKCPICRQEFQPKNKTP